MKVLKGMLKIDRYTNFNKEEYIVPTSDLFVTTSSCPTMASVR